MSEKSEHSGGRQVAPLPVELVPGLARIAAGVWVRGAVWGVGTTVRASRRLTEAAISGESAAELLGEAREEAVESLRRMLGMRQAESGRLGQAVDALAGRPAGESQERSLRARGAALFERASMVDDEDPVHPGFDRIVDQLAPDEARILKLLVNEGPQAIIYINRAAPLGIGAREVARRLSLIGNEAGCIRPDLVAAYLDNLVRLGLVAIRRDPLPREDVYQVVEAQPEVVAAMRQASGTVFKGQSSRRSVHLTDFGRAFCQVCFPPEHLTGETAALDVASNDSPEPADGDA